MRISRIHISNFRAIKNETFDFNDLNVIIGNNGTAKTTILEAINMCLSTSFTAAKVKYSDFHNGENCKIQIVVFFDNIFTVKLIDGYNGYDVACQGIYLSIKKRDNLKGITKAFTDGFVIKHFLIPNSERSNPNKLEWKIKRANGKDFLFTDRHLSEAFKDIPIRCFYFDKNRDRQLQRGYNSSITSVFNDFNWRFVKNQMNNESNDFIQQKNSLETLIKLGIEEKAIEKTFVVLNEKLSDLIGNNVNLSFIDAFEPFNNAVITNTVGNINLETSKLGSGIDMIISLMFLETLASLSSEQIILMVDEPELHLHPSLQHKLIEYFKTISSEHQILLSTHSPIFFKGLTRDSNTSLITRGGETISNLFPWSPSWGEINYFTYGLPTIDFHNELYGYLQSKAIDEDPGNHREINFEKWLVSHGCVQDKQWIRIKNGQTQPAQPTTLQTYVRNTIHHPENTLNLKYSAEEFKMSIDKMIEVMNTINPQ